MMMKYHPQPAELSVDMESGVRVQKTFKFEYTVVEAVDKGIDNGFTTKTLMEKSTGM